MFAFGGKIKFIQVDIDRFGNHRRNMYTPDWEPMPLEIRYPSAPDVKIEKPDNLKEMIEIGEKLADNFSHVRVDVYLCNQRIYFGELTFTNQSGFAPIRPAYMNRELGNYIIL